MLKRKTLCIPKKSTFGTTQDYIAEFDRLNGLKPVAYRYHDHTWAPLSAREQADDYFLANPTMHYVRIDGQVYAPRF